MFEYKFVEVELKSGMFSTKPKEDYRSVIESHAAMGWRLVQIFTPPFNYQGNASKMELIFEKSK